MKALCQDLEAKEFAMETRAGMGRIVLACILSFLVLPKVSAQEPVPNFDLGGSLKTFGELLREHNVELTESALLEALKSSNADVRYLSAMKLAEDKNVGAAAAIKVALAAETLPRDRANFALALGLLGDPSGRAELHKMCVDESFPSEFRLYAVRYLSDLDGEKDEGCLHATTDIANRTDSGGGNVGDRVTALELLAQSRNLSKEESKSVFDLLLHGLNDPDPYVRMQASGDFAELGDKTAIPYLKAAISQEKDENIRIILRVNLNKLRQKTNE
jgi:HEAT repeat protein